MLKKYFYTLDLIRFIAASIVAIFHLTWLNSNTENFLHWGWIGVQIFFVLSGFVILESARYGNAQRFLRSRVLRLYPVAIVSSIMSFVILLQCQGASSELIYKFVKSFLLYVEGPYLATAYWTLPIEMAFYLIIFLVIRLWSIKKIHVVITWMTLLSSSYLLLYSLQTFNFLNGPDLEFGYGPANMSLLRHGVYFSMGMILYLHFHNESSSSLKNIFYLAFTASFLEIISRAEEINNKIESISFMASALIPFTVFILFVLIMYLSVTKKELIPVKYQKTVRVLGLSSYPIYLLHEVVGNRIQGIFIKHIQVPDIPAVFISYSLVVLTSVVIATKIEPQIRRLLKKVVVPKQQPEIQQ